MLRNAKRPRLLLSVAVSAVLIYATTHALPPRHIRIAAGPVGGSFYETALQYQRLIEPKGFHVDIVPFENTNEIAASVADRRQRFDLGFVAGERRGRGSGLISLGDIQLQPIFIFENRQAAAIRPIRSFFDIRGMSLVMPPENSVTSRTLLSIFALSGVSRKDTRIDFMPLDKGITALKLGKYDAGLFILGADSKLMADLAKNPNLVMVQIAQQGAITKKLPYLKEVRLPGGIFDLKEDLPPGDTRMLAATISVVARRDLPPAIEYAVLEAMRETHRKSSYVNDTDEFPRYSADTDQPEGRVDDFYRDGAPWVYAHLPIAFASVIDAYLAPLLAFWVATSALSVIGELERARLFAMVTVARVALWWVHRQTRRGAAPSQRMRVVLTKIEAEISKGHRSTHALLLALQKASSLETV